MLIIAGKTDIKHNWPHKEIKSDHANLSLYEVEQPDGVKRHVFAVKVQATALPGSDLSSSVAIDDMIEHLKWLKDNQYAHVFEVSAD